MGIDRAVRPAVLLGSLALLTIPKGSAWARDPVAGDAAGASMSPSAQTVGLFLDDPASYHGYTLFPPTFYDTTYLIDNQGLLVHSWPSDGDPGHSAYLLENGHLLRPQRTWNPVFNAGGLGGRVKEIDWDGTVLWDFTYSDSLRCQHHDVESLPNGNVLLIAWEAKTRNEAIAAGRKPILVTPGGLWPDHIVEVRPTGPTSGTVVWEWHVWDHLIQDYDATKANYGVVGDHPELVDVNFTSQGAAADWTHTNSIRYHAGFDQILIGVHNFSEIWVIDHGTTTAQAASHSGGRYGKGGDLLYRWGNPQAYRRGTMTDRKLYGQHDAQWIDTGLPGAGNILIFNNGVGRPTGSYSSIDEITPPVDASGHYSIAPGAAYGPTALAWTYMASPPPSFYAENISGAERQPNGDTLICNGPTGVLFEVTPSGATVWKYVNPVTSSGPLAQGDPIPPGPNVNSVFKIRRYSPSYPGLLGRDLNPGCTVETGTSCTMSAGFTYSPAAPTDATPVTFTAVASGGTLPYTYSWDLGGTPASGFTTTKTFDAGRHTIVLTVTDAVGIVATSNQTLNVSSTSGAPPPVADGDLAGAAATFSKDASLSGWIDVAYDAATCSGEKTIVLYGNLGDFSAYQGCALSDAGSSGTASFDATDLGSVWFNLVWTRGTTAGHPGYGSNGTTDVERSWNAAGFCGATADDHGHVTCP